MAKILFLAHRVPFPPTKGDKIRAFHWLRHLEANGHGIWLGAGADAPEDLNHLADAKVRFQDAYFAPLPPLRRAANLARGLVAGAPLSVARFRHPQLQRWIAKVLDEVRPDLVFVYSSALAQYVVGRRLSRLLIDFVDADAEKWRAYAEASRPPMRWVYETERRRLIQFERRALAAAGAGLFVSETEQALFSQVAPEATNKLSVVPNGVDTEYFKPAPGRGDLHSIVMCGRMDYRPNVEGAIWFATHVLPRVRQQWPEAIFRVVGAEPVPEVIALRALPGVEVAGGVVDVRPHLNQAAAVVAPLLIARGIQNKVLEAMAAARPVVATPAAIDGINARVGRDVLVGADAASFAAAVVDVLSGAAPADLGLRARDYVVERHRWDEQFRLLDRIVGQLLANDASG